MIKNKPQDFLPQSEKLNGVYRGVVEDNNDTEQMGRCRVRIFGVHSEKLDEMPIDHLPWAEPALGLFEGGVSGFGSWSVPLQGSHVFLFFENGNHLQPRYFASAPGFPIDKNHGVEGGGFKDPSNQYPKRVGEPDYHRLTRNDIDGTVIQYKNENRDINIEKSMGQGTWEEPEINDGRQYPNNKVIATHGGIVVEIDDTDNQQRLLIFHPSNSYIEIGPEGQMIIKNNSNKFSIVGNDDNLVVRGDKNVTVDNNYNLLVQKESNIQIRDDKNEEVDGNLNQEVRGTSMKKATEYNVDANTIKHTSNTHNIDSNVVQVTASIIQLN